ncbi:MAG: transposase, partial [Actinomycetota bacterium]
PAERCNSFSAGISRILGHALTRFCRERCMTVERLRPALRDCPFLEVIGMGRADKTAAPSQIVVVQRFGEKVNLHAHFHVIASDGMFAMDDEGRLTFHPSPEPSEEDIIRLREYLRRRILRRMVKLGAVPEESAREMLCRVHGGFSLDGGVRMAADDRKGLERLLRYVLRPAVSLQRLSYDAECGLVRCRMRRGDPAVLEWDAVEFLGRFAELPRRRGSTWCATAEPWVRGQGCAGQ